MINPKLSIARIKPVRPGATFDARLPRELVKPDLLVMFGPAPYSPDVVMDRVAGPPAPPDQANVQ